MGVERTISVLNGLEDNYEGEMWKPIIRAIEKISSQTYFENKKVMRIIADHYKAACFIINDGVKPSNNERGYVLRRLIRKAIRNLKKLGVHQIEESQIEKIIGEVFKIYREYSFDKGLILFELKKENLKFQGTLDKGLAEFKKLSQKGDLSGKEAFLLYQSYGFPLEMILEECREEKVKFNSEEFKLEFEKHRKLSQTASKGRFKSGLADNSESTTKLHTAAHLLLAALKEILGKDVFQKGSNINSERLRFDFSFPRKLTEEEKEKIENLVNREIEKGTDIVCKEMSLNKAKKEGATGNFEKKYGKRVSVYMIGNFSKEICTGPHVKNTKELGRFKIIKEQSSSSGVRRIKAILE